VPLLTGNPGICPVEADDERGDEEDRRQSLHPPLQFLVAVALRFRFLDMK
jgi:hypothetical protein